MRKRAGAHRFTTPMFRTSSVVFVSLLGESLGHAHGYYGIQKQQHFIQTSDADAIADPKCAFTFEAVAATNIVLTLPGGGTAPLIFTPENEDYFLKKTFSSK